MKVIVTGGRSFADEARVFEVLDALHAETPITLVRHGAARGADTCANEWAFTRRVPVKKYPAQWDDLTQLDARIKQTRDGRKYDAEAGPRRNSQMLADGADMVVCFPGGAGTLDMTEKAIAARRRGEVRRVVVVSA